MIFALGFLVSGLLTLMLLPAFWRRALRLSQRRLEMQMPLSMAEIVAERDQLRADFAIRQRRIEQRCEALVADRAHDRGELGRRARLIGGLDAELAESKRVVIEQRTALADAERRIADLEGQFATAHKELFDTEGRLARVTDSAADLEDDCKALTALSEERRAAIAASETRAAGLAMHIEDLQRQCDAAARMNVTKESRLQRLGAELDFAKTTVATTASKLQAALARIEELTGQAGKLQAALDTARRTNLRLEAEGRIAVQSLEDAAEREAALHAEIDRKVADVRAVEQKGARQISALRAECSALDGALQTTRQQLAALRAELGAARNRAAVIAEEKEAAGVAEEDEMLRQTIKEIGAEVSRLVHTLEERSGETAAAGVGDLVRALQARAGPRAPSN